MNTQKMKVEVKTSEYNIDIDLFMGSDKIASISMSSLMGGKIYMYSMRDIYISKGLNTKTKEEGTGITIIA